MSDKNIPAGFYYAVEANRPISVRIPSARVGSVVAVIEPGHDPGEAWEALRKFLIKEGALGVAPFDSAA